jgi:hypothetical protein
MFRFFGAGTQREEMLLQRVGINRTPKLTTVTEK